MTKMVDFGLRLAVATALTLGSAGIGAQVTRLEAVSFSDSATLGLQASNSSDLGLGSGYHDKVSADGRYTVFESIASNLVPGDINANRDVFLHDNHLGITTRVSVSSAGVEGNNVSTHGSISADGRYITFSSTATNLVAGDSNGFSDVFVRDRVLQTTVRVSVSSAGLQANGDNVEPVISADGTVMAAADLKCNTLTNRRGLQHGLIQTLVVGGTGRTEDRLGQGRKSQAPCPMSWA